MVSIRAGTEMPIGYLGPRGAEVMLMNWLWRKGKWYDPDIDLTMQSQTKAQSPPVMTLSMRHSMWFGSSDTTAT